MRWHEMRHRRASGVAARRAADRARSSRARSLRWWPDLATMLFQNPLYLEARSSNTFCKHAILVLESSDKSESELLESGRTTWRTAAPGARARGPRPSRRRARSSARRCACGAAAGRATPRTRPRGKSCGLARACGQPQCAGVFCGALKLNLRQLLLVVRMMSTSEYRAAVRQSLHGRRRHTVTLFVSFCSFLFLFVRTTGAPAVVSVGRARRRPGRRPGPRRGPRPIGSGQRACVVGRGHASLLTDVATRHCQPFTCRGHR
jgi:hypothetical protein